MTGKRASNQPIALEPDTAGARDVARRAMFSAASRVLNYHATALEAKVARLNLSRLQHSGLSTPRSADQPGR